MGFVSSLVARRRSANGLENDGGGRHDGGCLQPSGGGHVALGAAAARGDLPAVPPGDKAEFPEIQAWATEGVEDEEEVTADTAESGHC